MPPGACAPWYGYPCREDRRVGVRLTKQSASLSVKNPNANKQLVPISTSKNFWTKGRRRWYINNEQPTVNWKEFYKQTNSIVDIRCRRSGEWTFLKTSFAVWVCSRCRSAWFPPILATTLRYTNILSRSTTPLLLRCRAHNLCRASHLHVLGTRVTILLS
jgi:hypothetical protein